jgi:hypothetical protein
LSPELTIAILAGVVALSSALVAVWGGLKSVRVASDMEQIKEQERRRLDLLKTTSKYREPLASAAFDLQSRIYNIIQQGFFNAYFTNGNERARLYAVVNTMFLFAQCSPYTRPMAISTPSTTARTIAAHERTSVMTAARSSEGK